MLSIGPQGDDIVITWQTAAGKTNAVEAGELLTNHTDIAGWIVTTGAQTNCTDVNGATNVPPRFHRLRLVPEFEAGPLILIVFPKRLGKGDSLSFVVQGKRSGCRTDVDDNRAGWGRPRR
jgi:hypothetical protein